MNLPSSKDLGKTCGPKGILRLVGPQGNRTHTSEKDLCRRGAGNVGAEDRVEVPGKLFRRRVPGDKCRWWRSQVECGLQEGKMTDVADLANLFRTATVTVPETRPGGSQQERCYRCQRYKRGDSEGSL